MKILFIFNSFCFITFV